jgi:hypothetical protein
MGGGGGGAMSAVPGRAALQAQHPCLSRERATVILGTRTAGRGMQDSAGV